VLPTVFTYYPYCYKYWLQWLLLGIYCYPCCFAYVSRMLMFL